MRIKHLSSSKPKDKTKTIVYKDAYLSDKTQRNLRKGLLQSQEENFILGRGLGWVFWGPWQNCFLT